MLLYPIHISKLLKSFPVFIYPWKKAQTFRNGYYINLLLDFFMFYRLMCLILVAVEKYPFTDQWHFTSGLTEKEGMWKQPRLGAPLIFLFHKEPHRLLGTCGPQMTFGSDAPASGHQDRQLSFLLPALLSLWRAGPDHLPSQGRFQKDYWWPSRLELVIIFLIHEQSNRIQRISLPRALAPGTIPASVFTENKQLCIVPLWQVNAW